MNTKRIEETYNNLATITKEDIGFPSNFINLTTEQERFIIDMYFTDRELIRKDLAQLTEEMKEIINDI
ncbi:hypothetical protein OAA64_00955 [bacterium]|jgi:hypothetical protein|nr:hypothetical protein [bacterium]